MVFHFKILQESEDHQNVAKSNPCKAESLFWEKLNCGVSVGKTPRAFQYKFPYAAIMMSMMTMILVLGLGVMLLMASPSDFLEDTVSILITQQYEQLGTDVILQCNSVSLGVNWKHNGVWIPQHSKVHANGQQLTLKEVQRNQAGTYSCHNPEDKKLLSVMELNLGFPPQKLDVHCWASGYPEKINCTWDVWPETHLPTTFITTYRLGLTGPDPPSECVQLDVNPHSCQITDFKMFAEVPYLLNVTAVNPLGSLTLLHHFFVENIIRPNPPVNVSLSPAPGNSRKLLLRWSPPSSWPYPDYFPLTYLIRYRRTGVKHYKVVGPYEQTFFPITGIRPGSTVHAQVAARDLACAAHYSDWSTVVTGQPWKPHRGATVE
ncbi:PREDICTED: interleukin-27 subunit beta-like [Nanorana parkeri]|uniref:interleukin-27 subunit beta-like n=1 Tax=Nanorana parkeri TaxID=125878 RepID=UPI000854599D|nr:PREDICTED: interleukin-27 subunit beta-like [Nanorana parkeri]